MRPVEDVLRMTEGDLSSRLWQHYYSSRTVTQVLKYLDSLGITCRMPVAGGRLRQRALACSLDEAIAKVQQHPYKPPRRKSKVGDKIDGAEQVRVLYDPTCLYESGASFRPLEVFGTITAACPFGTDPPTPDEWPVGIELAYRGLRLRNDPERGLCVVGML